MEKFTKEEKELLEQNPNIQAVGKSYTISKEDIQSRNDLSIGDADVRAIEIAIEQYFYEERGVTGKLDLDGNKNHVAYRLLTGKGGRGFFSDGWGRAPEMWFTDSQIDNFNKENHVAVVAAHKFGISGDSHNKTFETPNGEINLHYGHAYTVKSSDKENVYLINPWETSETITVPRDIFKDFFNAVVEFDL